MVKVDSAAIQRGPDFMYVYIIRPDKTVSRQTVTIGDSEGSETVVTSGLAGGERVVTDGVDKLTNNSLCNPTRERSTTRPSATQSAEGAATTQPEGKANKHHDHSGDKSKGGAE